MRATAINREGARLVGIWTTRAGALSFLLAAGIAAVAGILISPTTTIYYDTGLIVGLKGFIGSVVGGFVSYPLAAVGAIVIGLIEVLRLVLLQRAQGRDRVRRHHSDRAVALALCVGA